MIKLRKVKRILGDEDDDKSLRIVYHNINNVIK